MHLYYLLEHEYAEASLSLKALKLEDLARVQCLKQLTDELEFDILLAVLEKKEDGGVEKDWSRFGRKKKWYEDDYDDVTTTMAPAGTSSTTYMTRNSASRSLLTWMGHSSAPASSLTMRKLTRT